MIKYTHMKVFFSCDWGTSAFRLRLISVDNLMILSEIKTEFGIANAFRAWKQAGQPESKRFSFYRDYLLEQVKKIVASSDQAVDEAPIILSGMASSSIGMMELPYKNMPFQCDGSDLLIRVIEETNGQAHNIIIISGACSTADVVRGEETMLVGCDIANDDRAQLFIFPGTHSKHLVVKNGVVKDVITYMTGELFDLLSNKSILATSVKKNEAGQEIDPRFFTQGVHESIKSNLANSIFHVRTNQLFSKASPSENYEYLSGLLIGHELTGMAGNNYDSINLVCGEELKKSYLHALDIAGLSINTGYQQADKVLIKGQWKIIQRRLL